MTRNRECVLLSKSTGIASSLATALALLPVDQHPMVHKHLNAALHSALIAAEEIRQEWEAPRAEG